jgi:hypothetical protein
LNAPEATNQSSPSPPLRTWRPMVLWSAGILLALGLVWFVGAVVVPAWQTRGVIDDYCRKTFGNAQPRTPPPPGYYESPTIEALGGGARAAGQIRVYLSLPAKSSAHVYSAIYLLGWCGPPATPVLQRFLRDSDPSVRAAAAEALKRIRGEEPAPERRGDVATR